VSTPGRAGRASEPGCQGGGVGRPTAYGSRLVADGLRHAAYGVRFTCNGYRLAPVPGLGFRIWDLRFPAQRACGCGIRVKRKRLPALIARTRSPPVSTRRLHYVQVDASNRPGSETPLPRGKQQEFLVTGRGCVSRAGVDPIDQVIGVATHDLGLGRGESGGTPRHAPLLQLPRQKLVDLAEGPARLANFIGWIRATEPRR